MGGHKKYNKSVHTSTTRTVLMCSNGYGFLLATVLLIFYLPASEASTACSFNGNGTCNVGTDTEGYLEELMANNHSVTWKIRPQNIGFMYYLKTSNDGDDLSVKGIVKWKVQLKNWTPNDTSVKGFLVTILEHDTNATVTSYELTVTEPFEDFLRENDVMEMRLELEDVLRFDKRYDARINLLPIGKQAAASSFLSIMGKLDGEPCSEMKGLAERWAPHVMVDLFETTSEIELTWQPAPSFLCIQSYEIVLQDREGGILNTSEIEVTPGQKLAQATFGKVSKDQAFQIKIRGKNSTDGGCACVNCNCITDKTKYFTIPDAVKMTLNVTTPVPIHLLTSEEAPGFPIVTIILVVALAVALTMTCICVVCRKYKLAFWKQKIAFSELKTPKFPNRKTRAKKFFKVLLVCPELTGRENDYMMRILEAMKNSNNTVVCDRWRESFPEAEENMFHWVYEQTAKAEKIVIFHAANYQQRCGVYDMIHNFFPPTDPRLAHIVLSPDVQTAFPREMEYVMPRDQKLLEDAYDIKIAEPLVIDIPNLIEDSSFNSGASCERIEDGSPDSTKTHSTDSGVSSMSSNSGDSNEGMAHTKMQTVIEIHLKEIDTQKLETQEPETQELETPELNVEKHPLLIQHPISV